MQKSKSIQCDESEARSISRTARVHCLQKPVTTNFLGKIARNEPQTQWNNYAYRHTYIHIDKFTAVTDHALVTVFNSCYRIITISITLITLSNHVSIINSTGNTIIYN